MGCTIKQCLFFVTSGEKIRRDRRYVLDAPEREEQPGSRFRDRDRFQGRAVPSPREEPLQDALVVLTGDVYDGITFSRKPTGVRRDSQ